MALDELGKSVTPRKGLSHTQQKIRHLLHDELEECSRNDSFPLKPQRIVTEIRAAMRESDIVLVDTGALKMWMARLYPTYQSNTS